MFTPITLSKSLLTLVLFTIFSFSVSSCKKDSDATSTGLVKDSLQIADYKIKYQYANLSSDVLVVFEAGLGDSAKSWKQNDMIDQISRGAGVLIYDRAGYGESTAGSSERTIQNLSNDLTTLLTHSKFQGKKIVLVGHSYGGFIIRNVAINQPTTVKGLVFIDPTHEDYENVVKTQDQEDFLYTLFSSIYGSESGVAKEARQLLEATNYMKTRPSLPNIPVVVLTSMKVTAQNDQADRQNALAAQGRLGLGLTNFTQIPVSDAGHYVHKDKPALVVEQINSIIGKMK